MSVYGSDGTKGAEGLKREWQDRTVAREVDPAPVKARVAAHSK